MKLPLLVKEQMYKYLLEKEEERYCRELEEYERNPDGSTKPRRRPVTTPWFRRTRLELCQSTDLLRMVTEFDYDLSDQGFQDYCTKRGLMHLAGERGSSLWVFMEDHSRGKDEYMTNPEFQFAEEFDGAAYQYTESEMDSGWKVMLLGRARFQDCWETYKQI